eukprot:CAMPEP_0201494970 /NCGR_PEP_ID=MMETSP0151_2-20130828/51225_1 /ASSEMBLY_ACC=CAM_ASM_000257 /TAXON_ID=200890 /ORGANISM="Paramoeba atlantica, Strain 621/1 / CCAP 1560/9" /LENGTH=169 /DNA_ID=CAMNT_0047883639 /DNA_START=531 /DNA_END=1040 /DNA_ORIENTATION=+
MANFSQLLKLEFQVLLIIFTLPVKKQHNITTPIPKTHRAVLPWLLLAEANATIQIPNKQHQIKVSLSNNSGHFLSLILISRWHHHFQVLLHTTSCKIRRQFLLYLLQVKGWNRPNLGEFVDQKGVPKRPKLVVIADRMVEVQGANTLGVQSAHKKGVSVPDMEEVFDVV